MFPNAKYSPKFKLGIWSGYIRLFNLKNYTLLAGLVSHVEEFCRQREYACQIDSDLDPIDFSASETEQLINSLKLPANFEKRQYQWDSIQYCIRNQRAVLLSPTSSGKSLIIYSIIRHYLKKTLIIVPRVGLVKQLQADFANYGFDDQLHKIYAGQTKQTDSLFTVSTWQSLATESADFLDQFEVVIVDECHTAQAKVLQDVLSRMTECKYRFGFTGTVDETPTHKLVIEGLFGKIKKFIDTHQLIAQGDATPVEVKAIVLNYHNQIKKAMKGVSYAEEIKFIIRNQPRMNFIKKLALSLEGNTLILFNFEEQGLEIKALLDKEAKVPVYMVYGKVDVDVREDVRLEINKLTKSITVASIKTFSEGISIPSLNNIIFITPSKARRTILQSIGRLLRLKEGKNIVYMYDIVDDISWKSNFNYAMKHFGERVKYYVQEKFPYKIYRVGLK